MGKDPRSGQVMPGRASQRQRPRLLYPRVVRPGRGRSLQVLLSVRAGLSRGQLPGRKGVCQAEPPDLDVSRPAHGQDKPRLPQPASASMVLHLSRPQLAELPRGEMGGRANARSSQPHRAGVRSGARGARRGHFRPWYLHWMRAGQRGRRGADKQDRLRDCERTDQALRYRFSSP